MKFKLHKIKTNRISLFLLVAAIILIVGFTGFYIYVQVKTYPAAKEQLTLVHENLEWLIIEEGNLIKVVPDRINPEQPAIIFYPGGPVEPQAYLYKMGRLAEAFQAELYIVKPLFNAAIFSVEAAAKIIAENQLEECMVGRAFPSCQLWV